MTISGRFFRGKARSHSQNPPKTRGSFAQRSNSRLLDGLRLAPWLPQAVKSGTCAVSLHTPFVIRIFAHEGLEALFRTGSKANVQPAHAARLKRKLAQLDAATGPQDMGLPGWGLHALLVDYRDCH